MKKVLFYIPFIKTGGIEKVALEYLKGLLSKGYVVELLIDYDMGEKGNTLLNDVPSIVDISFVKAENISKLIYRFRTLGKKYKLFNLFLYGLILFFDFFYFHLKIKKIINNKQYDAVISFYQFLPSYITSIKNTKHIIWLHGSVEHFFGGIMRFFRKKYGRKLDKYDYICTIADEMKEQVMEFYPKIDKSKIKRIYNPVNFDLIKSKSQDYSELSDLDRQLIAEKYICSVSRIDENQKDITTLILAYEKLVKGDQIQNKLYIIGDGPHKSSLENLVKSKGLPHRILFLGNKNNPYVWMKNADLFILSSKFEGFGLVLVESMICETFVISSNCMTGPVEILQNGKFGDIFDVGNFEELATTIKKNLSNTHDKQLKILLAKEKSREFDAEYAIDSLIDII